MTQAIKKCTYSKIYYLRTHRGFSSSVLMLSKPQVVQLERCHSISTRRKIYAEHYECEISRNSYIEIIIIGKGLKGKGEKDEKVNINSLTLSLC